MTTENNTLGGRVSRYARVSTAMGGLAARLAGERLLGLKLERGQHASELRMALGNLKGPLMKVAQLLTTVPDALPPEYVAELGQLQSNAPPMGWLFVKRRMQAELGADWQKRYGSFEPEAAAAASFGQVHRATATDGRPLAAKLQYPDMQSAVEADLKQLKLILGLYERYDPAIQTKHVHAEIADRLREELDYAREAQNMNLYRDMLAGEPGVRVPQVEPALSTARLLTMSWLDGRRILDFSDAPEDQRNRLALNMFRAWYVPLYNYGVIHGDPHLGNYSVAEDDAINLLDFGCVRVFPARFVGGVIDLYHAMRTNDEALAVHAYETWGFKEISKPLVDVMNIWARFVYAPVLEDRVRAFGETNNGQYGRETAAKVHKKLREVGGVAVPREFVFMDRAALGLGSVFLHLKASLNWYQMFTDMIADFDVEIMAKRQQDMLQHHKLPLPEPPGATHS